MEQECHLFLILMIPGCHLANRKFGELSIIWLPSTQSFPFCVFAFGVELRDIQYDCRDSKFCSV